MPVNTRTEPFKALYCSYIKSNEYDKADLMLSIIQQIEIMQLGMGKIINLTI